MNTQTIKDILIFLRRSKNLQSVERYCASLSGNRNTVAEHSWRLALMTMLIGAECDLPLNMERAMALALIHDLAEAKTGDLDAYAKINGGDTAAEAKAVEEAAAMRDILDGLSFGDSIHRLWREYEDQQTLEAKFVKALDRIEGFLHIAEDGVGAYIPKEFHGDYADSAVMAFDEAAQQCPELSGLLEVIKSDLREQFERIGVQWVNGKSE